MWDMDEDRRIAWAMFDVKPELDPRSLLILRGTSSDSDCEEAGPSSGGEDQSDRAIELTATIAYNVYV